MHRASGWVFFFSVQFEQVQHPSVFSAYTVAVNHWLVDLSRTSIRTWWTWVCIRKKSISELRLHWAPFLVSVWFTRQNQYLAPKIYRAIQGHTRLLLRVFLFVPAGGVIHIYCVFLCFPTTTERDLLGCKTQLTFWDFGHLCTRLQAMMCFRGQGL